MRLFPRRHGKNKSAGGASGDAADRAAAERSIEEWLASRHGIEAFLEPQTAVTGTTMLLVAHDGEFTRRLVPSAAAAAAFAQKHTLPFYDAPVVGYPQRMRDYSRRQTLLKRQAERDRLN
ncbi:MAG: oxidoreductase [Nakamurella sp.]